MSVEEDFIALTQSQKSSKLVPTNTAAETSLSTAYGEILDSVNPNTVDIKLAEETLSDEEKYEIESAWEIVLKTADPDKNADIERVTAVNKLFSFGSKCLPYIREELLNIPGSEIEFGKLINNIAEKDDVLFIIDTLTHPRMIDNYAQASEIASRTLVRIVYYLKKYNLPELDGVVEDITKFLQSPQRTSSSSRYNCRNALSMADTAEAKKYLDAFSEGVDYLSQRTMLSQPTRFRKRINLVPVNAFGSKEEQYTSKQWQQEVRRLIRRSLIEEELGAAKSLSELKDHVRTFESETGVDTLIDSLVSEEFTISNEMTDVATSVAKKVCSKFPKVKGLVLLGSSVHGGARIRQVTKTEDIPDFDYALISDGEISFKEIEEVNTYVTNILVTLGRTSGFQKDIHVCPIINPSSAFEPDSFHTPQLTTAEDLLDLIYQEDFLNQLDPFLLYFPRSFPQETNEYNRQVIKKTLFTLASNDHLQYEVLVDFILSEWLRIHILKAKHFGISLQHDKNQDMIERVIEHAPENMSQPMRSFLEEASSKI